MVLTYLPMAKRNKPDPKTEALRQRGCLNPYPEKVADPLFAGSDFFDARDLVQVKYEMVRRGEIDGHTINDRAAAVGLSRPTVFQAQTALGTGGRAAPAPPQPRPPPAPQ